MDVSALMDKLSDKPASRRNTFAVLRRLFRWAVNRGDIESSVLRDMDAPPAPASRDRVLSDEELARIWRGSDMLGYPFGPFVRLLMLTGQRREEVAGLDWAELDQKRGLWTIPAHRAKNRVVHDVPLSELAILCLDDLANRSADSNNGVRWPSGGLVFTTNGKIKVSGYSVAKRRLDGFVAADGAGSVPPWRFHDLRRSLATGLQRLGVRFEVTEAVTCSPEIMPLVS